MWATYRALRLDEHTARDMKLTYARLQKGIVTVWDSNKPWKEPIGPPPFPAYIRKETDRIRHHMGEKKLFLCVFLGFASW